MPTNILDLPKEIWLEILSYFSLNRPVKNGIFDWNHAFDPEAQDLATLQATRLVCRSLQQVVDPLLCPVIRLSLDGRSSNRIEQLSRNVLIAQSVRGVEVDLCYRPTTIASDLRRYAAYVKRLLDDDSRWHYYVTELSCYSTEDQSPDAIQYRASLAALRKIIKIGRAWRKYVDPPITFVSAPEHSNTALCKPDSRWHRIESSYQVLLQDCFDSYAKQSADQHRIISDGTFVNTLAQAISRFPHPISLRFTGYSRPSSILINDDDNDDARLRRKMLAPLVWGQLEHRNYEAPSNLLPARILTELPIACDRHGAPIQALSISTFPRHQGFQFLLPSPSITPDTNPINENIWMNLKQACRKLKDVDFDTMKFDDSFAYRYAPIGPDNRHIINGFFGAICSSPRLQHLHLHMTTLKAKGLRPEPDQFYPLAPILESVQSHHLTDLRISNATVTAEALEHVIRQTTTVKTLDLGFIQLASGNYAGTVDALRARVPPNLADTTGHIRLWSLEGGEFHDSRIMELAASGAEKGKNGNSDEEVGVHHLKLALLKQTKSFICGNQEGRNPLRRREV